MIGSKSSSGILLPLTEQGLQVRPGRFRDLKDIVPMLNRSSMAMFGAREFELARYHAKWRSPDLDLENDTRLVLTGTGEPVGLVEFWNLSDPPVHPSIQGRVDPRWEGRGIGSALLKWARQRALASAQQLPGELRVSMRCNVPTSYEPAVRLMASFGMRVVRKSWDMVLDLDQDLQLPLWPAGIMAREFRFPRDARRVYQADQAVFRDHWGFVASDDDLGYHRWRHHEFELRPFDPSLWFLAMDGDEIAGFALCRPYASRDPAMGWISTLGVLPSWRRRGLGLALLRHAFCEFKARGKLQVGLGVDSENLTGATQLYRAVGMRIAHEQRLFELELRPGVEIQTEELPRDLSQARQA